MNLVFVVQIVRTKAGPRLVKVSTRCHGGAGTWLPLASECIGYTQLEATLNCYLRPDQFDSIPAVPVVTKQGMEVFLISSEEGIVRDIPGLDTIRSLDSFLYAFDSAVFVL